MKGFIKTFRAPIAYLAVSLFFLGYANYEFYEGSQASFWLLSGVSALFMVNAFATVLHISRLLKQEEARQAALEATRVRDAQAAVRMFEANYAYGFHIPDIGAAKTLARNKLLESMNDTQRHTFLAMSYFDVISDKGHLWRIHTTSITGNVELLAPRNPRNVKHTYCIHLKDVSCPAEDHWLAQALLLKISEKDFLSTAF